VNDSYDDHIEVKILANPEQSVTTTSSWQQHMKSAVRTVETLLSMVGLEEQIAELPPEAKEFPVFVPLPFLQRMENGNAADPLLKQVLPVAEEGHSPDHYSLDPLQEQSATLADGLIQKYRKRVLVIASAACAINCRYCFRRHFPYETAAIGDSRWVEMAEAIRADETINEVILSGGDPLSVSDKKLASIFETVANIDHVKRLRIHTRLPIVIPDRITDSLLDSIWKFRKSAHGRQVVVVIHSNHENELDQQVSDSLRMLNESATQLLNQSVLLAGVNDNVEALVRLSERLMESDVLPYYLHQMDPIRGTAHFEVPIARGIELVDAMRAQLPGYAVPRYVQELAGEANKKILA
jgi:EF-P beta-lysylation protein EpmB